jgi:hypothetical protein
MNVPNETFDLIREKQELDAFLSTFMTVSPPLPVEEAGEPGPVPCIAPSRRYTRKRQTASVGKGDLPGTVTAGDTGSARTGPSATARVEPVSLAEPVGGAARTTGGRNRSPGQEETEQRPDPPQYHAPPVFASFCKRPARRGSGKQRRIQEMEKTLRLRERNVGGRRLRRSGGRR